MEGYGYYYMSSLKQGWEGGLRIVALSAAEAALSKKERKVGNGKKNEWVSLSPVPYLFLLDCKEASVEERGAVMLSMISDILLLCSTNGHKTLKNVEIQRGVGNRLHRLAFHPSFHPTYWKKIIGGDLN